MSNTIRRIRAHKKAKQELEDIYDNPSHILIIHYSCESFYHIKDGKTPRITSIGVRFFKTAQTKSFSIHKVAEKRGTAFSSIQDYYSELEKEMLKEFFAFVKLHRDYKWLHWNMRNINYGFEAIEYRYSVLGGNPFILKDENRLDIARTLTDKYGVNYIEHPRLTKLIEKNNLLHNDILLGNEEAKAFENKEYVKLHQSTLKKVDVIDNILKRSVEDHLKTNSNVFDIYGLSAQGLFEIMKDHWLWSLLLSTLSLFIGWAISKI